MKQLSVNKVLRGFAKVLRDSEDVEIVRGEFGAPVKGSRNVVGYFLTTETYLKLVSLPGAELPLVKIEAPPPTQEIVTQDATVNGIAVTPPSERLPKEPKPCSGPDCTVKTLFVARGADGKLHPLCHECQKAARVE